MSSCTPCQPYPCSLPGSHWGLFLPQAVVPFVEVSDFLFHQPLVLAVGTGLPTGLGRIVPQISRSPCRTPWWPAGVPAGPSLCQLVPARGLQRPRLWSGSPPECLPAPVPMGSQPGSDPVSVAESGRMVLVRYQSGIPSSNVCTTLSICSIGSSSGQYAESSRTSSSSRLMAFNELSTPSPATWMIRRTAVADRCLVPVFRSLTSSHLA